MKKLIFFSFMVVLSLGLNAQKIGVKMGLDMHKFSAKVADNKIDYIYKPGFNISAFYEHDISFMSIRPEIGVYQKGAKYEGHFWGSQVTSKTRINYFHCGIDLKLNMPSFPIYAIVGTYSSFALAGEYELETVASETETDLKFGKKSNDNYKAGDFGLNLGIGASFEVAMLGFFVEAKYDLGLRNISNDNNTTYRNCGFILSLGTKFGF